MPRPSASSPAATTSTRAKPTTSPLSLPTSPRRWPMWWWTLWLQTTRPTPSWWPWRASISRNLTTWPPTRLSPDRPPGRARSAALAAILYGMRSLFHLAFHVTDLDAARRFYGGVLGCQEGRSTDTWVDFDFFGHQISLHLGTPFASARTGHVGDHLVPMPHFGAILELPDWHALAARLKAAGTAFVLEPQVRFEGQPGEQWTMFFHDPSGNPIEIKGFRSLDAVYAS